MQSTKYEFYGKSNAHLWSKSVPLFDQFLHLMDGKLLGKYSNSSCVVRFFMSLSLFVILFTPWQSKTICIQSSINKRNKFLRLCWHRPSFNRTMNARMEENITWAKKMVYCIKKAHTRNVEKKNLSHSTNVSVVTISPIVNTSLVHDETTHIHCEWKERLNALSTYYTHIHMHIIYNMVV